MTIHVKLTKLPRETLCSRGGKTIVGGKFVVAINNKPLINTKFFISLTYFVLHN